MPSTTVENYLKAIYTVEARHGRVAGRLGTRRKNPKGGGVSGGVSGGASGGLAPMGEVAGQLGVTAGTATLMIKRLSDQGLVHYEPRQGVRLSRQGRVQALSVLRRHRLIELFLVQVVGLDWSQVHDEAEVLEHAISDRLLERIDAMLGRPEFDPHGDPIPAASGQMVERALTALSVCEPGPVRIARVTDDGSDFLKFLDEHGLAPSTELEIEARDPIADTITLRHRDGRTIRLGLTAAARILVESP